MRPKAVVLLGAGASLDFGLPSTNEVYKYIIAEFQKEEDSEKHCALEILTTIECKLCEYYKDKSKVNFESIFHALSMLSAHFFPSDDKTSDSFRFIDKAIVSIQDCFHKYKYEDFSFVEIHYVKFLNKLFVEKSMEFKNHKNYCYLKKFFCFLRSDYQTKIFSLNYDDLPLQCYNDLYTGFTNTGEFDKNIFQHSQDKHTFFQLHGSIHHEYKNLSQLCWSNKHDGWLSNFTCRQDGAPFYSHNLITGYDKSDRLQNQPFRTFLNLLEFELSSCETVFIIGYGFNDLHINAILKDYLKSKKVIFISSQKKKLKESLESYPNEKKLPLQSLCFFEEDSFGRNISIMQCYDHTKTTYQVSNDFLVEVGEKKYLWIDGFKSFIEYQRELNF